MAGLYRGPIIDAHIHLWDLGMDRHPWLRPTGGAIQALGDLAPIRRNYLVDDYRRDAANQNVVATVYIEAAWDRADDPLAEIEWLETLDKSSGVAARYIGFADLTAPDAAAALGRLSEVKRCVGVRQMLSWHPTKPARSFALRPGIANEEHFRRGVALLASHDQLLEFMLYPYQAKEVARLAQDFPNQTFILNTAAARSIATTTVCCDGRKAWSDSAQRPTS
jgi:predicted TIM-barrel fold metal-dependent hydrolase